MKNYYHIIALICVSMLIVSFAHADKFYKLESVQRVDSNLYSFRSGIVSGIVVTRYCYEYPYNEEAILKYEEYSYDNKIIFNSGKVCEVVNVYTK